MPGYYANEKRQPQQKRRNCLIINVGVVGFEPTTPCSQSRCANRTALYPEKSYLNDPFDQFILLSLKRPYDPPEASSGYANRTACPPKPWRRRALYSVNKKENRPYGNFMILRREGDSNPRYPYGYGSLANCWFQPLTHLSGLKFLPFAQTECKYSTSISTLKNGQQFFNFPTPGNLSSFFHPFEL